MRDFQNIGGYVAFKQVVFLEKLRVARKKSGRGSAAEFHDERVVVLPFRGADGREDFQIKPVLSDGNLFSDGQTGHGKSVFFGFTRIFPVNCVLKSVVLIP